MTDENRRPTYSQNEIDLMLKNVEQSVRAIEKSNQEILDQVRKTNGRVTALEKWRAYLTGAVAIIMLLGLPNVIELLSK